MWDLKVENLIHWIVCVDSLGNTLENPVHHRSIAQMTKFYDRQSRKQKWQNIAIYEIFFLIISFWFFDLVSLFCLKQNLHLCLCVALRISEKKLLYSLFSFWWQKKNEIFRRDQHGSTKTRREREGRSERPNSEEMVMMVKRSSAVFAKKIKRY